ncbi:hypothetical protein GCM10012275_52420 [Longimycelium tulufanense]|uniref:S-adenosylmethionine synthetase C-terminal domain-containing protein n=1 Tax=Longimycelium tulufanense TaxID=907463 RepID=A0A8J3CIW3_9PSEU|nr:hypothetical protein GCM10012275_52420 [Longimycelium tulufanense]
MAYAIGKAAPVGLFVETFGTETVDPAKSQAAISEVFDLRPAAIIRDLDLPWERTDRADAWRSGRVAPQARANDTTT